MIISIDGPAASGKSTTARLLAKKLDFIHLNTGLYYRAITYIFIKNNLFDSNQSSIDDFFNKNNIELKGESLNQVYWNEINISSFLFENIVNEKIHITSNNPIIRKKLVSMQRLIGQDNNIVCEGRDIGSVVFPNADFKFFLVADLKSRIQRRFNELKLKNPLLDIKDVEDSLTSRDYNDSTRINSPLIKPLESIEIDTTKMTIEMQVNYIYKLIKQEQN
ncbi:MAG: cytidylate kinase [Candidatus Marinimicrobia bacterium]|nr:cytidylate kinase [Candidatus Neomarinimicrobiota bacterium]MAV93721.1 cytidylate kinase [Candidatus Neomarinimicrobiota bacterium]|tara:strand:- start:33478 stop:34137 length:660 start_codon:yes stop_codon:yes gene_type:complete